MKRFATIILSPMACLAILAGMWAEARARVKPVDAEPYHRAAKAAIASVPYQLSGWVGRDEEVPDAAVKLLRPNYIVSRKYMDPMHINRSVGLLVVQCKDSRDMLGHYPPVCYPGQGMIKVSEEKRTWDVHGTPIGGTEYVFAGERYGQKYKTAVYNFMIVPGVGIVPDMKGVERAAEDYQQRYFGAAQFQVTLNAEIPQYDRDRIFADLIGGNLRVIDVLKSGGIQ